MEYDKAHPELLNEVSHLLVLNNEHKSPESHESQEQIFQKSQATERISRIFLLLPYTDFG